MFNCNKLYSDLIFFFAPRCRPLNNTEKDARSYSVVDCPNSREVTVKEKSLSNHQTKTFQFDKVFGVQSKQLEVYRAVVEPLILQVNFTRLKQIL